MKISGKFLDETFNFKSGSIYFENSVFSNIEFSFDDSDNIIIPGLIDIHAHGCVGEDYMDSDFEGFNKASLFQAENGTTTFIPTLLTFDKESIKCASVRAYEASKEGVFGANLPGIHLEGPFFGSECIGANNVDFIRDPSIEEIEEIQSATDGFIKLISIDPSLKGAIDFIKHFKDSIKIALGHSAADFDTAMTAINAGASDLTHTYNGMKPMLHRSPNMLAAAFNSNIFMEIISDGFHVHPEMVKIAYKLAGRDRLVFITDSLCSMGYAEGVYEIGGLKTIVKDGTAMLEDGTICGGMTPLYKCILKAVGFGIPFEDAVKCASLNPAKAVGIDDKYGSIKEGNSADFIVLDKDFKIKDVFVRGKSINA